MLHHRRVAVKVLRGRYAHDPALLPRFLEAARQAAAVSHQSVAKVYDHGEGGPDGAPYLVTEFIEGPALAEVIRGEEVRASFIATALAQVAEGLHAAHQAGLLHGDLKPANILLQPEAGRRATVTDFGITHALGAIPRAGHTPGTAHGTGTVLYLAPERVSGGLGTAASDLYSLGIIACEWLTGTPPFAGTSQQVLAAHLRGSLPRLPAAVPPGLAELVARLVAKDQGSRFRDASEVAAAARALARELREDARNDAACFPARLERCPDLAVIGDEAAVAAPGPGDESSGSRLAGLAAHKREIAWAASALVLAGLIGWAPSAPIQSAVKIVQLAIPAAGHRADTAGYPAAGRQRPGGGDGGYSTAGNDGGSRLRALGASWPRSPGGQQPGERATGKGGSPGPASGNPDTAGGGRVAGSGSPSPSPTAPGGSSATSPGPGPGSQGPCPCGPASPLSSPTSPASPTSHPAPGTGTQPPSAPASQPVPLPPVPLPPAPLPIPTISVSVPPLTAPSALIAGISARRDGMPLRTS
jgi:serine/threonine-protein kinase